MNSFFAQPLSFDETQKIIGGFSMAFGLASSNPHCSDSTVHKKNSGC